MDIEQALTLSTLTETSTQSSSLFQDPHEVTAPEFHAKESSQNNIKMPGKMRLGYYSKGNTYCKNFW